jgi:tRNA(Ile)-lysidine synthetase-like protein
VNIQNALLAADARHQLFERGGALVVGVSGGADSLALLHALAALRKRLGLTLIAATLDHGLRGEAGAADAAHAVAMAQAWGVPTARGAADVAGLAAHDKLGIEAAGRRARYQFLASVAREHGAARVAVAHHADDQAETVLMHLLRGAGLDGLAGMLPVAPLPGAPDLQLVRPLLSVTRAEIIAYCARHAISARDDATNLETAYTRAWLRHDLMPLVETRFPGAARALAALAESAALDRALIAGLVDAVMTTAEVRASQISLPRASFRELPPALQLHVARRMAALLAPGAEISHERARAAVDLWARGARGRVVELPAGLRARLDADRVVLERAGEDGKGRQE